MEFNNKKLEKTSKLINYTISIVLFCFLVSLSNRLIDDVDDWKEKPSLYEFQNTDLLEKTYQEQKNLQHQIQLKNEKKATIHNTLEVVNLNYENEKKSFDNWIETRKTIGSPTEDKEILARANQLDIYYKNQQEWKNELSKLNQETELLSKQKNKLNLKIRTEKERAEKVRSKAIKQYELKVFLIRLLFILPILILGIFFIVKYRKHKYWPLFLGFIMFSFYAFFFGLVPYLPSYGGYIRYSIGIILSILLGIYAINKIRAFIEQKKKDLEKSTTERAKKVQTETAEKALDNHMCPSCGKDFIIKKWDKSSSLKKVNEGFGMVTNFCRFCGLELFKKCTRCGTENFAHLPFCANCGDKLIDEAESK